MREGDRFLPWMLRLTRNCCVDRLRRLKVRTPAAEVPVDEAPQIATAEPSPEDSSLAEARHGLLYRAIARLGEKNREMILLREIQELKLEEIAEMLGLPLGTVKSRSHRARLELAKVGAGARPVVRSLRMDCRELEDRLEALLDGELDELERRRCARHLEGCPSCRELAEPIAAAVAPPADLVGAVLARTSGSACGRAESLLCDWLDGELTGADRELMAATSTPAATAAPWPRR